MTRPKYEALIEDDGGDVIIEHDSAERIFNAPDEDGLINEGVQGAAQPPPFARKHRPALRRYSGYDQCFKIGPAGITAAESGWQDIADGALVIILVFPIAAAPAKRTSRQRASYSRGQCRSCTRVVRSHPLLQRSHEMRTRIRKKFLWNRDLTENRLEIVSISRSSRPCLRHIMKILPAVGARRWPGEKLVNPVLLPVFLRLCLFCHGKLPRASAGRRARRDLGRLLRTSRWIFGPH